VSTVKSRAKKEGYELIEYLVLRFRKLPEFPAMKIKTLAAAYERYTKTGTITEDDKKHLAALIRKVRESHPLYSPENLAACYAYAFWIKQALRELPPEKHEFLQKVLMQLYKKMFLTPAQAAAVNRWIARIARIPGVPTLDPTAFTPPT